MTEREALEAIASVTGLVEIGDMDARTAVPRIQGIARKFLYPGEEMVAPPRPEGFPDDVEPRWWLCPNCGGPWHDYMQQDPGSDWVAWDLPAHCGQCGAEMSPLAVTP